MDRRFVLAIVLMMVVLIVPPLFLKKPVRPVAKPSVTTVTPVAESPVASTQPVLTRPSLAPSDPGTTGFAEDTVVVQSALYQYRFSTRGGRLVGAALNDYRSMRKDEKGQRLEMFGPASQFLFLSLLVGRDTVSLSNLLFRPSAPQLDVTAGAEPSRLTFSATIDSTLALDLTYGFTPKDYRIDVRGSVRGLGPTGGTLLIGMGPGLRNTESDSVEHSREVGVVTRNTSSELTHFAKLKPGEPTLLKGPFHWVALKSKYFVTGVLASDTGRAPPGRLGGVSVLTNDRTHGTPEWADVSTSVGIGPNGDIGFSLYVGPMEYPRLQALGHGFDDVNPYGWAWLRPVIRPVAVGARWLLVWLHEKIGLAYGLALVVFGVGIRLVLWPLNQRAMRASMAMQAIQPVLKEIQDKHQKDPQRLQQEMFKVYKENNVNPFSGCWPVLLPWPILIALFFVFQNSIELRGQAFLWVPDLSRPDPLYVIPVLMAVSMFGVTKIGQMGMPVNPQMKMMLYFMPIMMLVLFLNFASGLNLYYAVQNLASIPQQWLVAQERVRRLPPTPPATPSVQAKGMSKR